ncbi:F0F1 ATP synthase subunit A [Kroppenstedtia eburnea]|uniref:ATP synthase subunit a n=1 Tax=Kroppenstedtia eburnea TaxID=714067 RepID=A0A1N7JM64_9BACL|nr:F0F1 ATP synthase subunit A [Kroppenstedtia eburnea]QKI83515.1 F0F1 ATP synthase subunit A [Kroppenstedtia eburnea]SIS50418.1 F-type H+-transporting ATPase subunit a [Kroppenstedtia eburnea]
METTPKVEFLNMTFDLTIIIGTVVTCLIVFLISVLATRGRNRVPKGLQNLVEMGIDFVRGITRMAYDSKTADKYVVFSYTLFMFILVANQLGIFLMVTMNADQPLPGLGIAEGDHVAWFKSPTADLSVTLAMAIAVALYTHIVGIRSGLKNYLGHYLTPLGPIHLIEEFSKPLTHGMRLWANIFAGEILITIMITEGSPLITGLPVIVWMGFSLFVGAIQAYIFTVLANVYISQKMAH